VTIVPRGVHSVSVLASPPWHTFQLPVRFLLNDDLSNNKNMRLVSDCPGDLESFMLFPYLHDDLKMSVLSFVADAPLEAMPKNYPRSFLTNELPRVSQKFRRLSTFDGYWKDAVLRQMQKEPFLWKRALRSIASTNDDCQDGELVEEAHNALGKPTFKSMYEQVLNNHLRFKGPVWSRPGNIVLGVPYPHSDARDSYFGRVLQAIVQDDEGRNGGALTNSVFVHANRGHFTKSTPAVLVRVLRCVITDETCEATMVPLSHVWLESMWVRDNLPFAQCLRMGRCISSGMNRLARQEALVHIMDQLVADMMENELDDQEDADDDDDEGSLGDDSIDTDSSSDED